MFEIQLNADYEDFCHLDKSEKASNKNQQVKRVSTIIKGDRGTSVINSGHAMAIRDSLKTRSGVDGSKSLKGKLN
jgi:hypothetical protein